MNGIWYLQANRILVWLFIPTLVLKIKSHRNFSWLIFLTMEHNQLPFYICYQGQGKFIKSITLKLGYKPWPISLPFHLCVCSLMHNYKWREEDRAVSGLTNDNSTVTGPNLWRQQSYQKHILVTSCCFLHGYTGKLGNKHNLTTIMPLSLWLHWTSPLQTTQNLR